MSGRTVDPIIQGVRQRMVRARTLIRKGTEELEAAQREIRRHPDCKASLRATAAGKPARERASLAWWYHAGLESILDDMPLGDAASCISDDLRNPRQTMEEFIRDEEEVLARRAARRAA